MDQVNFNYSLKNVSLPNKDTYRKNLIQNVESFTKRIRQKAFFIERQCKDSNEITANFGFKSVKIPPKNENLNEFESDLYDMVQNIEFEKVKSNFQIQLSNDVKNIKNNPNLLVPADKTNNVYELTIEEYNKLLIENISKKYKRIAVSAINSINTDEKLSQKILTGMKILNNTIRINL